MTARSAGQVALVPAAIAYGLAAEGLAGRHGELTTYAGGSGWATVIELAVGWGLVAAGLATWHLRRGTNVGPLVVAAGFAWFARDWVGWEGGPELVRSLGMLAAGVWLALLVHAVLAFPERIGARAARVLVAAVYAETAIVGLGRALFRDPFDDVDCWANCVVNSFLLDSNRSVARALDWIELRFAILLAVTFVAFSAWRLATASAPARRLLAPVLVAGVAVATVHAAHAAALLRTPLEAPRDKPFAALFLAQCLAVAAIALALAWELARWRGARRAVERLVVELVKAPALGSLEEALARVTGDPSLRISYRLPHAERYVDALGRDVSAPAASATRAVTPIVRDDRLIAQVEHDPASLDAAFENEIGAAVRLAVENERLHAETLARLIELRESRTRIVASSDAVRSQLERDLHDGAQQRLVALSFGLRVALGELGPDAAAAEPLAAAQHALEEALGAVRAVANGLFPATLASSGLAYAVEELAEHAPIRIDIEAVPDRRLPTSVEAAAYGLIREAVENAALHAGTAAVSVRAVVDDGAVIVDAVDDGIGGADPQRGVGLLDVADRVGALGGRFSVLSPTGGGTHIHAEIPMRVVIADDVMLMRTGIARLLADAGVDVVGEAADADRLLHEVALTRPDVAIVDIRMPPNHADEGLVAAREIRTRYPEVGALVLSQYLAPSYAVELLEAHPERTGYLLKERVSDIAVLVDALRRIAEGECVLDPTIVARIVARSRQREPLAELTEREREVLALMAEGRSNAAIAERLVVTTRTVEAHIRQILGKLDLGESPDDHRRVLAVLAYLRS